IVLPRERHVGLAQEQGHRLDDLVRPLAALLDARARHLVLAGVPARAHAEDVAVVGDVAERRDLLGEDDGMPNGQDENARGDLDLAREGGRVGEDVERLEPRVAIQPRRREEMVDDPDVQSVLLALLDGLPDPRDALGIALATAPGVGRNPGAEPELCHRPRPPWRLFGRRRSVYSKWSTGGHAHTSISSA